MAVLGIFLGLAAANFFLLWVFTGGSDQWVMSRAIESFAKERNLVGSISVSLPGKSASDESSVIVARGRFALPEGKTLIGTWNIFGSLEASATDGPNVAMAMTDDGEFYLRDNGLVLPFVQGLPEVDADAWVQMDPKSFWVSKGDEQTVVASEEWEKLFSLLTDSRRVVSLGRGLSDEVAGQPTWHFLVAVDSTLAYETAQTFTRLKLGRDLTSAEIDTLRKKVEESSPKIDLWVSKSTSKIRQVVMTYMVKRGESAVPVIITVSFKDHEEWTPVEKPQNSVEALMPDATEQEQEVGAAEVE